jgi:hypothetical protein
MALKDLLVYVDQTEASSARLRLAADLAIRNDSRLTRSLRERAKSLSIGLAQGG